MNIAERMASAFARQVPGLIANKDLCCLPSAAHIMRAICFERSPTDRRGCYVVCFFILPATREEDVNLSNGLRLRRNGYETTWQEAGDAAELLSEFNATAVPFFEGAATLSGIEEFFLKRRDQHKPLGLRHQESLFYCLLLQQKYDDAYRIAEQIIEHVEGELNHVYQGKPDPTDWRLRFRAEISRLRDLLAKEDTGQIRRVLEANEKTTYDTLSWPIGCIGG